MLREIIPVPQPGNDLFRRWFEDEFFDLIVWYNQQREIHGFQLCYQKSGNEQALTWIEDRGYAHHRIDSGEQSVWETKTPVLTATVAFPRQQIIESFLKRSNYLQPKVLQYVVRKLEEYG